MGSRRSIDHWIEIDDDPENWYHTPPMTYRNLFVIRFDESDRCTDFTEWYIEEGQE